MKDSQIPNPEKKRILKCSWIIGIDVSKEELDFTVLKDGSFVFHREIVNSPYEIVMFIAELKMLANFKLSKALFCMENTGLYCSHLLNELKRLKTAVCVENAMQIKRSLGVVRGKNDKIDSFRIAQYALKNRIELKLWTPKRQIVVELAALFRIRKRLKGVSVALKTPLKEQREFIHPKMQKKHLAICVGSRKAVLKDIERIDHAINKLIHSDEELSRLYNLTTSVPRVGPVTASLIIICTNEFKDISDPKKFACYAGVAPFNNSSGKFIGKSRVSLIANREMKSLLHICAMGAVREEGELKEYYERKKMEGKPSMLILNAIRNKLITRVFACVRHDRKYTAPLIRISEIT